MNIPFGSSDGIFDPSLRRGRIKRHYPYRRPIELALAFWLAASASTGWFMGALTCDDNSRPVDHVALAHSHDDHGESGHNRQQRRGHINRKFACHSAEASGPHVDKQEECCTFFLSDDVALPKQTSGVTGIWLGQPLAFSVYDAGFSSYFRSFPRVASLVSVAKPQESATPANKKMQLLI